MAGHTHGATSGRLLWISLIITLAFVGVEFAAGLHAHSVGLMSDAGHNLSDAAALGLAAYAIWVAKRPASHGKTFGYHRVAILTALLNAAILVVIALGIFAGAAQALQHPAHVGGRTVMVVAGIALVMNTVIAALLSPSSHHSLNARAAYIHMAGDALSSLGVLAAGAMVTFFGWTQADPIISLAIGVFILYTSWGVINDATNILMEGSPKDLDVNALVGSMRAVPGVLDVHDLHVWTVGDGIHFLSCHVVVPDEFSMIQSANVVSELNDHLSHDFGIGHATLQTELAADAGCRSNGTEFLCGFEPLPHDHSCSHGHAH